MPPCTRAPFPRPRVHGTTLLVASAYFALASHLSGYVSVLAADYASGGVDPICWVKDRLSPEKRMVDCATDERTKDVALSVMMGWPGIDRRPFSDLFTQSSEGTAGTVNLPPGQQQLTLDLRLRHGNATIAATAPVTHANAHACRRSWGFCSPLHGATAQMVTHTTEQSGSFGTNFTFPVTLEEGSWTVIAHARYLVEAREHSLPEPPAGAVLPTTTSDMNRSSSSSLSNGTGKGAGGGRHHPTHHGLSPPPFYHPAFGAAAGTGSSGEDEDDRFDTIDIAAGILVEVTADSVIIFPVLFGAAALYVVVALLVCVCLRKNKSRMKHILKMLTRNVLSTLLVCMTQSISILFDTLNCVTIQQSDDYKLLPFKTPILALTAVSVTASTVGIGLQIYHLVAVRSHAKTVAGRHPLRLRGRRHHRSDHNDKKKHHHDDSKSHYDVLHWLAGFSRGGKYDRRRNDDDDDDDDGDGDGNGDDDHGNGDGGDGGEEQKKHDAEFRTGSQESSNSHRHHHHRVDRSPSSMDDQVIEVFSAHPTAAGINNSSGGGGGGEGQGGGQVVPGSRRKLQGGRRRSSVVERVLGHDKGGGVTGLDSSNMSTRTLRLVERIKLRDGFLTHDLHVNVMLLGIMFVSAVPMTGLDVAVFVNGEHHDDWLGAAIILNCVLIGYRLGQIRRIVDLISRWADNEKMVAHFGAKAAEAANNAVVVSQLVQLVARPKADSASIGRAGDDAPSSMTGSSSTDNPMWARGKVDVPEPFPTAGPGGGDAPEGTKDAGGGV